MKTLIDDHGKVRLGLHADPVDRINYQDFDLRTVMDKRRSRLARQWRFNRFQFVSAMGPDWLFGLAIVDLRLVSSAFFYLYDFRTGGLLEHSLLQPFARRTRFDPLPEVGEVSFNQGLTHMAILPQETGRQVVVESPQVQARFHLTDDRDPLRLACAAGYNGWVFTRKSAGLPVSGEVRWDDTVWRCDDTMRASIDWSCGFMRRETAWNWACLAGKLSDGRSVGLNLASGVNETGITENALWFDGKCLKLDLAQFEFNRYAPGDAWGVTTSDGRVHLRFVPSGVRRERLNVGILASNFRQYAGTFEGNIVDESGATVSVTGLRGLIEDHFARW
ncbi:DUF2804 domain-containing protein [Marinobacter caseinilyticus]|uniref:DUF2804 domain-containing protein n=1 Tax=Marinobacter caseinilyticus TaxID=2692195 RepID=UPI00140A5A55|nr:DUF2804 domain-containing protein [Marinobacter caseinilyticus]